MTNLAGSLSTTESRKEFNAAEATELHEYLTERNIPVNKEAEDGKMSNEQGNACYLLPLIDRVELYVASHFVTSPS